MTQAPIVKRDAGRALAGPSIDAGILPTDRVPGAAGPAVEEPRTSLRGPILAGLSTCALLAATFGVWAGTATLAGAVLASGSVVVDTNLKKVQHPTGGVIGEIRVRDGARVNAGDVVVRLDETQTRANLQIIVRQLDEIEARRARLTAERDDKPTIEFPPDLLKRAAANQEVAALVDGERQAFAARRAARASQKQQLQERIGQFTQQVDGLQAQVKAKDQEIALIAPELKGVEQLLARNLTPLTRVNQLRRDAARLEGDRGALVATIAQAGVRISETRVQILQIDQDAATEILKELRESDAKFAELSERRVAAEDQLRRVDLRAPQDGVVHQLAVHTVGGVINAAEVLMLIVPERDALTVEARVNPADIDQVRVGREAYVRFPAFNQRTTPELMGEVRSISPDATRDPQTGASYFTMRVELTPEELGKLGDLRLGPGMPAEIHVRTAERTAWSFLVKPLTDQFSRAFRER